MIIALKNAPKTFENATVKLHKRDFRTDDRNADLRCAHARVRFPSACWWRMASREIQTAHACVGILADLNMGLCDCISDSGENSVQKAVLKHAIRGNWHRLVQALDQCNSLSNIRDEKGRTREDWV